MAHGRARSRKFQHGILAGRLPHPVAPAQQERDRIHLPARPMNMLDNQASGPQGAGSLIEERDQGAILHALDVDLQSGDRRDAQRLQDLGQRAHGHAPALGPIGLSKQAGAAQIAGGREQREGTAGADRRGNNSDLRLQAVQRDMEAQPPQRRRIRLDGNDAGGPGLRQHQGVMAGIGSDVDENPVADMPGQGRDLDAVQPVRTGEDLPVCGVVRDIEAVSDTAPGDVHPGAETPLPAPEYGLSQESAAPAAAEQQAQQARCLGRRVRSPWRYLRISSIEYNAGGLLLQAGAGSRISLSDLEFNGVSYTAHTSGWQRRAGAGSPWMDVSGTERQGELCGYNPATPGEYRLVADMTIGGRRGSYSSENTLVVN